MPTLFHQHRGTRSYGSLEGRKLRKGGAGGSRVSPTEWHFRRSMSLAHYTYAPEKRAPFVYFPVTRASPRDHGFVFLGDELV